RGETASAVYTFSAGRICVGRGAEVRNQRHHLIRTNDVAFTEGAGDVNASVSRQHAHLDYDATLGEHRLHDDGSAHGTGIVRGGRTVTVPRGGKGVRLRSGDE